ncbi:hypothetical protein H2198_008106 [Neophaeococcomyces mojaviensis]|uniref:Uncharacterized protein n=1 Tax=Neophaeococcomyces mojaviensis TaxID=3383035 RepID=A0ACC2ZY00_9EURO|nr:hypothetical protein H2198_008106 [Knufia sp. JES_112]
MAADFAVQRDQDLAQALAISYGTTIDPNQLCHECREWVCSSILLQQWRQRWLRVRGAISQGKQIEDISHDCRQHIEVTWNPAFRASVKTSYHAGPCKERVRRYQELAASRTFAVMHCHMCSILLSARTKASCRSRGGLWLIETGEVEAPIRLVYQPEGQDDLIPLLAHFEPNLQVKGFLKRLVLGALNVDAAPSAQHLLSDRGNLHSDPLSTHVAGVEALSKIKTWLSSCQANHHRCNRYISPGLHLNGGSTIPTRLLEIIDDPLSLRCIPGTFFEFQPVAKYVALSYRWGETSWDDSSLLTKDKLAAWHDEIHFSILPKTIQDAIYISYHLGFRYLWIDRLCILQDCEDDFAREAANMGAYYANAALNIAALDETGAQDPLFTERNPLALQRCYIDILDLILCTEEQLQSSNPPLSVPLASSGRSQHGLQSRAWIFQEEHLSPRTVYFSRSYMFWECRTHCESEPFVLPFPRSYVEEDGNVAQKPDIPEKSRWVRRVLMRSMRIGPAKEDYFLDLWARTLVEYTQRQLSKETDR